LNKPAEDQKYAWNNKSVCC